MVETLLLRSGLEVIIRPYEHPRDFQGISEVNKLTLRVSFMYLYEPFSRKYPSLFLIAEEAEACKKIAFVLTEVPGIKGDKTTALIYAIGVHPDFKRQGIGSRLVEGVLNALRTNYKKVKTLYLHVQETNEEALQFYKDYGFKEKKFIKKFYSWGEGAYRLYYEL